MGLLTGHPQKKHIHMIGIMEDRTYKECCEDEKKMKKIQIEMMEVKKNMTDMDKHNLFVQHKKCGVCERTNWKAFQSQKYKKTGKLKPSATFTLP